MTTEQDLKDESGLPMVAFFLKKDTNEVIIDFLGKVHASDNLVPITPEQASKIENEQLWGSDFDEDDSHLIGGYYDR